MIVIVIESTKRRGRHLKKKDLFNKNRAYFISNVAQWFRKSHIIELGYRGVAGGGGAAPPRLLMKRKTNGTYLTSPIPDEIHDPPPLPIGHFIFTPPVHHQKNFRPPPPPNITGSPQLVINDSSLTKRSFLKNKSGSNSFPRRY